MVLSRQDPAHILKDTSASSAPKADLETGFGLVFRVKDSHVLVQYGNGIHMLDSSELDSKYKVYETGLLLQWRALIMVSRAHMFEFALSLISSMNLMCWQSLNLLNPSYPTKCAASHLPAARSLPPARAGSFKFMAARRSV